MVACLSALRNRCAGGFGDDLPVLLSSAVAQGEAVPMTTAEQLRREYCRVIGLTDAETELSILDYPPRDEYEEQVMLDAARENMRPPTIRHDLRTSGIVVLAAFVASLLIVSQCRRVEGSQLTAQPAASAPNGAISGATDPTRTKRTGEAPRSSSVGPGAAANSGPAAPGCFSGSCGARPRYRFLFFRR